MNLPYMVNRIEIAFWTTLVSALQDRRFAGRVKYTLLAAFAAATMLLALLWARLPSRPAISAAPASAGVAPLVRPANGQSNLLVVLVDRLDSRQPRLLSVWLLGRLPALPQVAFMPIFPARPQASPAQPTGEATATTAANLPAVFTPNAAGGLPEDFVAALRQRGLWWDNYIILDQPALVRLVDLLGGVELDGRWLDGRQVGALDPEAVDPQTAWSFNMQLMQQVCVQASRLSRKSAAEATTEFAGLVQSDLPTERLQATLRGLQAGGTVCNFPTEAGR
jgi:hypothetical protein